MIKRVLPILMVLILMASLTTIAFADPSSITTFDGAITVNYVVKTGDISADTSFDRAVIDQALELSDEHRPVSGNNLLYYCTDGPVTVTFNEVEDGNKAISWYVSYYLDIPSEPAIALTEYDVTALDADIGNDASAKAFRGTITMTKPGTYYIYAINHSQLTEERDIGIYIVVGDTPIPDNTPVPADSVDAPTPAATAIITDTAPVVEGNRSNLAWIVIPVAIVAIIAVAILAIKHK